MYFLKGGNMKKLFMYEYLTDEEWKDLAKENGYDLSDEEIRMEIDYSDFQDYLDYTRSLLDQINEKENIVIIADLGLWNGRVMAYKVISNNARDIITSIGSNEYPEIELNNNNELFGKLVHHDGTNYYRFRVWRAGISDTQKDKFLDLIYNQEASEENIVKYTKALRLPKKIFA